MAFCLTLGKEQLQIRPWIDKMINLKDLGWGWYIGCIGVIETSKLRGDEASGELPIVV